MLAVVLLVKGALWLHFSQGDLGDGATAEQIRRYFDDEMFTIFVGTTIFWFGLVAMMWFLGYLRDHYMRAEGGTHQAASLAFAGGIGMVLLMFAATAPTLSGAILADDEGRPFSPATAETLYSIGDGFFTAAEFSWLVFMVASTVLILRTGCCRGGSGGSRWPSRSSSPCRRSAGRRSSSGRSSGS